MDAPVSPTKDLLDALVQLMVIVIPIIISWFIRTYLRDRGAEPKVAAITRMANSAIDYAENLDKRGELNLPPDVRKGLYKLQLAGNWLEDELKRVGISMTDEEAKKWIASEFQRRIGGGGASMVGHISTVTKEAVEMVQTMARNNIVTIPPNIDRFSYLAGLAADWVVTQTAQEGVSISREEAMTWVRAELFKLLPSGGFPTGDPLADLARQAIAFLDDLKARGQFSLRPGEGGASMETDLATAWVLTEAAKQGLSVTSDQIVQAVRTALAQRGSMGIVKT
jgi:hypothetical protein